MTQTTNEVNDPFNRAFQERDVTVLVDIDLSRLRQGERPASHQRHRYERYDASFSSWKALNEDTTSTFQVDDVHTGDELGAHPLALRTGARPRRLGPWRGRRERRQDRRGRRSLKDGADRRRP